MLDTMRLQELESAFDGQANLIRDGDQLWIGQKSLDYAILLLRRNQSGDCQRAGAIIEALLAVQLHTPDWDRGRFPFKFPESWRDLNATLFMAPQLAEIYTHWLPGLPESLAIRFRQAVSESVEAVERRWSDELFDTHRDYKAYSNIFVLYIQALLMFGRCLDSERLRRDGESQWQRWFNHISTYGIDEFCSPTYNEVVYEGLLGILANATGMRMQSEVKLVLDHVAALQHAVNHPVLRLAVVGLSRDYRRFLKPGGAAFRYLEQAGETAYQPPEAVLNEFQHRVYPYRASGRATVVPFRFQTWQLKDAAMGSMTGGNYFFQQIHLMVAVGTSPLDRACAFFQAERDNPVNGYVAQRDGRALCLFARTATSYWLTQHRKPVGELPLEGTKPPCLGLSGAWAVRRHEPGCVTVSAHGYTLHLQTFTLNGNRLEPALLTPEKLEIEGEKITGWRAAPDVIWFVCMAELTLNGTKTEDVILNGNIGDKMVTLSESGGLTLRLARQPSGELVELYDEDWRTLPLFESPVHQLWPGDLATGATTTESRNSGASSQNKS